MRRACLLLVFAVGCASAPVRPTPAARVRVTLQHLPDRDGWRVHYELPRPTSVAVFYRQGGVRLGHWRVLAPADGKLVALGGKEVLIADHPSSAFDLELPTYLAHPDKDYEVFTPFADGSVVVYTGQFDLAPVDCRPDDCPATRLEAAREGPPAAFVFQPRPSEGLVLAGEPRKGEVAWSGSSDGTMVYFGTHPPERDGRLTYVIDRGFPAWLRGRVQRLLPELFRFYERRTGVPLSFQPTVLLSYGDEPEPGRLNLTGGTRQGIVQLDFRLGKNRRAENDPVTLEAVLGVVAHESAHLWNSEMFQPEEEQHSWMHEGGAQAFAYRALVALGALSPARYAQLVSNAASDCAAALRAGTSLEAVIGKGEYQPAYDCGWVIADASEAAVRRRDPKKDLFDLWADLFRASAARHAYGPADYFRALSADALPADASTVRSLAESAPLAPPDAWLAQRLTALGLPVQLDDRNASEDYVRKVALSWVKALAEASCTGLEGISPGKDAIEIRARTCAGRPGALSITGLEGHGLFRSLAAVDAAAQRCASGAPVRVSVKQDADARELRCPKVPPSRSRYLSFAPSLDAGAGAPAGR